MGVGDGKVVVASRFREGRFLAGRAAADWIPSLDWLAEQRAKTLQMEALPMQLPLTLKTPKLRSRLGSRCALQP